jgi:hypothetical protein
LWLAVASQDAQRAALVVQELWGNELDPEVVAAASRSIDLDAAQATCPACGETLATADLRCGACGLRFG